MRLLPIATILLFINTRCSVKKNKFVYFKALTLSYADSATVLNKGFTSDSYILYNLESDSMIYKKRTHSSFNQYETYAGILNNAYMLDTIRNVIKTLEKYKNGVLEDTTDHGDMDSWPVVYIEYKDDAGVHYYKVLDNINDTIGRFSWWLFQLEQHKWEKEIVNNDIVNSDAEAIQALKQLGEYDDIEMPYTPLPCNSEINFDHLIGKWRSSNSSMHIYDILTILKNGKYSIHRVGGKHQSQPFFDQFRLNKKENRFSMGSDGRKTDYNIIMLNENCFEYKDIHNTETRRWYRLSE